MNKQSVILLTGAAGFIGSYLLGYLNQLGYEQIIISDEFSRADKLPNYSRKKFLMQVERDELFEWLKNEKVRSILFFISEPGQTLLNLITGFMKN